ncbi:hypothetical protein BP6252_04115 [Coleophoma cylindrospora]|uniref:N-acetyltransferase domain-containing protein n=1 Tax=Coleophoma cylindrospora TaxID=1849047 RepID=A0A3D8RZJ8_9HELO|nr:hypothetical protein BP6252_04115 [Coleophoma cylindrospora]
MTSTFYTHESNLFHPTNQHFQIHSTTTPDLVLRNATPADNPILLRLLTDVKNVGLDESVAGLDTPEAISDLIKKWNTFEPLERVNAVIVYQGTVIGTGGIGWISTTWQGKRIGNVGVMIDTPYRGKGLAYEALRMSIDYAFRVLDMELVDCSTRDENKEFRGLMDRKFGFAAERIKDLKFGNDWTWTIERKAWEECSHSK